MLGFTVSQRRNTGGPRHEASERVTLRGADRDLSGWTLNVSRGGVRIVLEEPVRVGEAFDILMGDATERARAGRVVWVRNAADGQIIGLQFVDGDEPPPLPSDPTTGPPSA
jgi:hypothetical protein